MFSMMNEERLGVGIQGLGVAEIAYQSAVAYAKERLQGRSLSGAKRPDKPADPIIVHPDVRRMLMTDARQDRRLPRLSGWVAHRALDRSHKAITPQRRGRSRRPLPADDAGGEGALHRPRLRERQPRRAGLSAATATSATTASSSSSATAASP